MIDFIQNTVDGIMIGSRYSLLAIGFTLIFGVMRRLNLSYGPSIMLGVFVGTFLFVQYRAGWFAIAAATFEMAPATSLVRASTAAFVKRSFTYESS